MMRRWGIIGGIIIRGYRGKKKRGKKGGRRRREREGFSSVQIDTFCLSLIFIECVYVNESEDF